MKIDAPSYPRLEPLPTAKSPLPVIRHTFGGLPQSTLEQIARYLPGPQLQAFINVNEGNRDVLVTAGHNSIGNKLADLKHCARMIDADLNRGLRPEPRKPMSAETQAIAVRLLADQTIAQFQKDEVLGPVLDAWARGMDRFPDAVTIDELLVSIAHWQQPDLRDLALEALAKAGVATEAPTRDFDQLLACDTSAVQALSLSAVEAALQERYWGFDTDEADRLDGHKRAAITAFTDQVQDVRRPPLFRTIALQGATRLLEETLPHTILYSTMPPGADLSGDLIDGIRTAAKGIEPRRHRDDVEAALQQALEALPPNTHP